MCKEKEARIRYCSTVCIKRAYNVRKYPNRKSFFIDNPGFWETETGIGFRWERYAAKVLGAVHLEFNHSGPDLDWHGDMVDVKSCKLYHRKMKRGKPVNNSNGWWVFNKNNEKPEVKYFFCICLDKEENIVKQLLIPKEYFTGKGITVGHRSRFDEFKY